MDTNKHTLLLYWQQIRKFKLSFFISLVAIPLSALSLDTLLPYFLSQAIGGLSDGSQSAVTHSIFASVLVGLIGVALNLTGFQALIRHEGNVRFELAKDTFARLINKDLRFFVNQKIGALTSRYIDFLRSHVALQDLLLIRTLSFVLSVGTGLVIVALQSPVLALILAALLALIVIQVQVSLKLRAPLRHARKRLIAESNGKVADAISNSLIVKTFANEKVELDYIDQVNNSYRDAYQKDFTWMALEGSTRILVMAITQIVSIVICSALVLSGQMDIPVAVFMLIYLQRISSQLFTLGEMLNGYDRSLLEAAPMSDILAITNVVNDKNNALVLNDISPTIIFNDVTYQYDDSSEPVIDGVDITIKAGEKIGLVGRSGAGKTTITHLLLRFSDVTHGSITVGGHDIRDVSQESLRKNIAYVPQEPMLFHRTLRENIAYGKPEATDEEILQAVKQANAFEFVTKLEKGLDTIVGERGIKLSGGQRQRVAIARAILKDAPILVLDEATSALDSESEKLIQDALTKLMKGRTSIVIAHRLSTISKLDRIIVLGDGKITEQGTHSELLAQHGTYANLWSHQSGGFIEE